MAVVATGGTGSDSTTPTTYTMVIGNTYIASTDANRLSISPSYITVPFGVTISPKSGYLWGWYSSANQLQSGGWVNTTYTGTGATIGIAVKREDESNFNLSTDSNLPSSYLTASDESIWNSSSSDNSGDSSGTNDDLSTFTWVDGNRFVAGYEGTRLSSDKNIYLTTGTVVTINDNTTYKWALGPTTNATANTHSGWLQGSWTTEKSWTISEDGYYGIVMLRADGGSTESLVGKLVSDYITLS